jgi:DNA-binding NarL/FixJ family response regulator
METKSPELVLLSSRRVDAIRKGRGQPRPARNATSEIGPAAIDLPMPSEGSLRKLFDLTPAEARLAQRLACGDSVEEVASTLHIKMTTARTQLAAIFAKTETRRQAKLVAILSHVAHLERNVVRPARSSVAGSADVATQVVAASLAV